MPGISSKKTKKRSPAAKKELSKTALKKLISKLDRKATKIFNKYVREKAKVEVGVCPLCLVKPIQCCFHIVTAMRKSTRYNEENVLGTCFACNNIENYWSDLSRAYYIRTYGSDRYLAVVDASKKNFEFTKEYLEGIISKYTNKMQELEKTATPLNQEKNNV